MAEQTPAGAANAPTNAAPPSYSLVGQYTRDLSFESPGAPGSVLLAGANPKFELGINVGVKKQADDLYAVELNIKAKAERDENVLFNVELVYGGVFRVKNITEQQLPGLLMVECPRMIFPFARHVLATVVQLGGFPPLMMEPVDFTALYLQNLKAMQAQQAQGTPAN
jgi:preprotein translocase subunit SecB